MGEKEKRGKREEKRVKEEKRREKGIQEGNISKKRGKIYLFCLPV